MRDTVYTDVEGRKFKVKIPEEAPDSHSKYGIIVGPPDLTELKLPLDVEVRLNNQLYDRGIFTYKDAVKRRSDVIAALQSTLALHATKIVELYRGI